MQPVLGTDVELSQDLRHAAECLMTGSGRGRADRGHARNSTTLDIYGHAVPATLANAMATLERAIAGA